MDVRNYSFKRHTIIEIVVQRVGVHVCMGLCVHVYLCECM